MCESVTKDLSASPSFKRADQACNSERVREHMAREEVNSEAREGERERDRQQGKERETGGRRLRLVVRITSDRDLSDKSG